MHRCHRPRITFITGTDTGVGKTLLTALLLCHLRRRTGRRTLALKPFCSGSRADARLLHGLQDRELALEHVNPYFFREPVAPLVAARKRLQRIALEDVLRSIQAIVAAPRAVPLDHLLIEGSGGLLVPLGEGPTRASCGNLYTVLDLISALACEVIVVARNRLGTINHSFLTVRALQDAGLEHVTLVLMGCAAPDPSTCSNARLLSELIAPLPVHEVPFLQPESRAVGGLKSTAARLRATLAQVLQAGTSSPRRIPSKASFPHAPEREK